MNTFPPETYDAVICEIQQHLRFLQAIGCRRIEDNEKIHEIVRNWQAEVDVVSAAAAALNTASCRRCGLADERRAMVYGAGPESARLMFIGGFPGQDDETTGQPFSGEAGALLTRIIEAMSFSRESVYISHVVKCRPAGGRAPNRFETRACRKHIDRQIEAVGPEVIIVLGEFAARALFGTDTPIDRLRGRFCEYGHTAVMPTHDPAYLLANASAKRAVWEDMKQVMQRVRI
ncbi:MAG: uracil-DNA glycosylase [Thermodesulfobacteriota bacterium]